MNQKKSINLNTLIKVLSERMDNMEDRYLLKQNVFYGIKVFNDFEEVNEYGHLIKYFKFASRLMQTVGQLTLTEFMNVFPITKDFKGYQNDKKDYFSTMEYLNNLDWDDLTSNQVETIEFLMAYANKDIHRFCVNNMLLLSKLKRAEWHLDMIGGLEHIHRYTGLKVVLQN